MTVSSSVATSREHWNSTDARPILEKIVEYRERRTFRPTVVVVVIDHHGRFLVVRHNTPEANWGLIQGLIEEKDATPVAAGLREGWEEGHITAEQIHAIYPYFGNMQFAVKRDFDTGFSDGSWYVFIGIKLKAGADISLVPPPGHKTALLNRKWCSTVEEAIEMLREQPGVKNVSPATRVRIEEGLIPTLKLVREALMGGLLDLLDLLAPIT